MKRVCLQYWEESEINVGVKLSGCSLHIDVDNRIKYINSIYDNRSLDNIPSRYDKIVGGAIEVDVIDYIYDQLLENSGSLRIMQHSTSNLINFQEIVTIYD